MITLRPFQSEALEALKEPGHLICIAPTGSGKSLIYERFALQTGSRTLLLSPLVALARQQERKLRESGVRAAIGTRDPDASVWIISPEMLAFSSHVSAITRWRPDFLVVDECHCLWDWGEDFRPAFNGIPDLIHLFGIRRSLWLTATLPSEARRALLSRLDSPVRELGKFDLPSRLTLEVAQAPWLSRASTLFQWLDWVPDRSAGVVFVSTREGTERVGRILNGAGRTAIPYHAGLSQEERRAVEARLRDNPGEIVVATSAFGMGMDLPHLRWAVLWQAPPSMLALAQAIGRVGRAGGEGRALILWDWIDFKLQTWMVRGSERRKQELTNVLAFLKAAGCRRQNLRKFFDSVEGSPCVDFCDFCSLLRSQN